MKTTIQIRDSKKTIIYRKIANKIDHTGLKFWQIFKDEIDKRIYKASYTMAFDPTEKTIDERNILIELQEIAIIKLS